MALGWFVHSMCTPWYLKSADQYASTTTMKYPNGIKGTNKGTMYPTEFQIPLHYPRYKKDDYEKMEEWRVDMLLKEYGIGFQGTLDEKRSFAMGSFLWPDQF